MREAVLNDTREAALQDATGLTRMDRLFKKLLFLIPLGIIGNVVFTLAWTDSALFGSVAHFSPVYLALAAALSIVPWFTGSLRLLLWSGFLGRTMRYQDMFRISIGAELGAAISPPLLGGSAVKVGMLMQHGFTGTAAVFLASLESLEDGIFFILLLPIALTVTGAWQAPIIQSSMEILKHPLLWSALGGICAVLCIIVIGARQSGGLLHRFPLVRAFEDRVGSSYENFTAAYRTVVREGKGLFALTMVLTALQWTCRYSVVTLLFLSLGIPAEPVLFMALQVIVFAFMAFVPTPGGAGGAEVMFTLLYGAFLPSAVIGLATTGWRFLTFYFLVLLAGALFLMFRIQDGQRQRN